MKRKSALSCIVITLAATSLFIFSYESQTAESSAIQYESRRPQLLKEMYYNEVELEQPLYMSTDISNISNDVTPNPIIVGERELVGLQVTDLDIEIKPVYEFTDKEVEILQRIAEAESTAGNIEDKKNVISCVLNRVESDDFPDSIKSVVMQKDQFSSVCSDGRYYKVEITEDTIQAVEEVMMNGVTHDYLYFFNMKDITSYKIKRWINNKLVFGFKDDVGHSYYNPKE